MSKAPTPATNDAVALLKDALATGRMVLLSLDAPPRVNRVPSLVANCRRVFDLTLAEALVFVELLEKGQVEREPLQDAMSRNGTPAALASLRVVIYKVRQKLAVHGVAIELLWGQGYAIPAGDRARAREILAGYGEGAVAAVGQAAISPD